MIMIISSRVSSKILITQSAKMMTITMSNTEMEMEVKEIIEAMIIIMMIVITTIIKEVKRTKKHQQNKLRVQIRTAWPPKDMLSSARCNKKRKNKENVVMMIILNRVDEALEEEDVVEEAQTG